MLEHNPSPWFDFMNRGGGSRPLLWSQRIKGPGRRNGLDLHQEISGRLGALTVIDLDQGRQLLRCVSTCRIKPCPKVRQVEIKPA
jgi:hypothetical protein